MIAYETPAATVTRADRAYAAGFFDGEGYLGLHKRRSCFGDRSVVYFALIVEVAQNDGRPLYWLQSRWGGSIREPQPGVRDSRACSYSWNISTRNALSFLLDVRPFVIVKREQVELAVQFQRLKMKTRPPRPLTPKQVEEYERLRAAMKAAKIKRPRLAS